MPFLWVLHFQLVTPDTIFDLKKYNDRIYVAHK